MLRRATETMNEPASFGAGLKATLILALVGVVGMAGGFGVAFGITATVDAIKSLAAGAEAAQVVDPSEPAPLFFDWPEQAPDLAFVLTGEMLGYMRPCGCSPDQLGGLARRGGLLDYLANEKHWTTVPLDLGDLAGKRTPWETIRYTYALESLEKLGYPAIGVGSYDLSLSINEVLGQAINLQKTKAVLANLGHEESDVESLLGEGVKKIVAIERNGLKIAISALMSPSLASSLPEKGIKLAPPDSVATAILKEMAGADLKVLLAQMPLSEAEQLAAKQPGFDLILCLSKIEDSASSEARWVGGSMVTWVGRKGKSVGVVGYWKDQTPKLRFEVVPLTKQRFAEDPAMNAIYARFVQALKDGDFAAKLPKTAYPSRKDEFVGAETCGKCHTKAYAHWRDSKHAHAFESLQKASPPGQDFNPECIRCHATGVDYRGGFVSVQKTPLLVGNQCENCHGPGKAHSDNPKDSSLASGMRLSRNTVERRCVECHDAENSVHFKFDSYWPKIAHPWRD